MRTALRDAMAEAMRTDNRVFLMGEDIAEYNGSYKVTMDLLKEFGPDRVMDTPISELGFAGIGVGAAMAGMIPVIEFMTMNFAMQAIDNIVIAAKTLYMSGGLINVPIVFRGPNGTGIQVAAQHSQCYASWYAHVPGLIVIAPYDANSAKILLKKAIFNPNPVVFLEHEIGYGDDFEVDTEMDADIGKAAVVKDGYDITIVSFSRIVGTCIEAAINAEKQGISCEVIDLRTLRPLDIDAILSSLKKTHKLLVVEEGWGFAGITSEIITQINEKGWDLLDAAPQRVCALDVPLPYAKNLEAMCNPSMQKILDKIRDIYNDVTDSHSVS